MSKKRKHMPNKNSVTAQEKEKLVTKEVKASGDTVVEVKVNQKAKDKNENKTKKKEKVKKPNKIGQSLKNTGNELKKVTWPKFKQVCKQTGIVLVFVVVFTVVLFGFDRLCMWLSGLLF